MSAPNLTAKDLTEIDEGKATERLADIRPGDWVRTSGSAIFIVRRGPYVPWPELPEHYYIEDTEGGHVRVATITEVRREGKRLK